MHVWGKRRTRVMVAIGALCVCTAGCSDRTTAIRPPTSPPHDGRAAACADTDGDGIADRIEGSATAADADRDGTPNHLDRDSDNDKISDRVEASTKHPCDAPRDTDKDGKPDYIDSDSDGDGIADTYESAADADRDGAPNFRDLDADNDTLSDAVEKGPKYPPPADSDRDATPDFLDLDSDDDGLSDKDEKNRYNTDPTKSDTDGDGASDALETLDAAYDPLDPKKNPKANGDLIVVAGHRKAPQPARLVTSVTVASVKAASDVDARLEDVAGDAIDAVKTFGLTVAVDNRTSAKPACTGGHKTADRRPTKADGVHETFVGVTRGAALCFSLSAQRNVSVAPTKAPQMFRAKIHFDADGAKMVQRTVFVIVPPRQPIPKS